MKNKHLLKRIPLSFTNRSYFFGLFLCLLAPSIIEAQNGDLLFDNSDIHIIQFEFEDSDFWDTLANTYEEYNTFSGSDMPYLMARVTIDGQLLDSIGVRLKGKSSYFYVNDKKPMKIDLNEFVSGQEYDGLKKFNLHNSLGDPGMQRDLLCYELMREQGVPAPRISFARVFLNNQYWGIYKIVEQIDQSFLDRNFADDSGNLWKNQRWSNLDYWGDDPDIYRDTFELKTNKEADDWTKFIEFLDVLNNTPDDEFAEAIQSIFNVDSYLHVLAIDILSNNWDSYIDNRRNWYLYHEPASDKFHWIPWDYNLALGGRITTSGNPYPPYDESCPIQADFFHIIDGQTLQFNEISDPPAETWLWDFGDGNTSSEQNPLHTYEIAQEFKVCLMVERLENGQMCSQTRCQLVDVTFDPNTCESIQNGSSPYPGSDPYFQTVIAEDEFCCEEWDVFCHLAYQEVQNNPPSEIITGTDYTGNFPVILDNPEKILIHRLMQVPAFQERYLEIVCLLRNNYFNEENLYPKIDYYADLLRDGVTQDPLYQYTTDYFLYDTGNGTGGGEEARIPALKWFFDYRFDLIDEDLANQNQDCSTIGSPIAFQDIVINELMASSSELSNIADSEGEYDDWIELYNNTNQAIDLFGFYLSDDLNFEKQWAFPQGTILPPNAYLIIWADKDIEQSGLHANFKLSKSGESLLLIHEDGTLIDEVSFNEQETDVAWARYPNGTGDFIQQAPTFNVNNETVSTEDIDKSLTINVFPNPVQEDLNIYFENMPEGEAIQIRLFNALGILIFTKEFSNTNHIQINLSAYNLPTGMYFLETQIGHLNFPSVKRIHEFALLKAAK